MKGSDAHVVIEVKSVLVNKEKELWSICSQARKNVSAIFYRVPESLNGTIQIVRLFEMIRIVFDLQESCR